MAKAAKKRSRKRRAAKRRLRSDGPAEYIPALKQTRSGAEAYWAVQPKTTDEGRRQINRAIAIRDGFVAPPWMKPKAKPGSAAAWIDMICPRDWRLMTAKQVHQKIEKEAERRGIKKRPSYRDVARELKNRR